MLPCQCLWTLLNGCLVMLAFSFDVVIAAQTEGKIDFHMISVFYVILYFYFSCKYATHIGLHFVPLPKLTALNVGRALPHVTPILLPHSDGLTQEAETTECAAVCTCDVYYSAF